MTLLFDANTPVTTGSILVFRLKVLLVSAGWVVKASGDGLSAFNSSGDVISSGSSGANGLANSNAWFRIQDPGGLREFCYQRGATNPSWKVKYSAAAKFTGGSPSATVLPTSTDEQFFIGATGSFGTWMDTDSTYRWNAAADNATPYGFWSIGFGVNPNETPTYSGVIIMDPMATGSFPAGDTDPVIIYSEIAATSLMTNFQSTTTGPRCWFAKGLSGETFQRIAANPYSITTTNIFPSGTASGSGIDPFVQNKRLAYPIPYSRILNTSSPGPGGWKGIGSLMQWNGLRLPSGTAVGIFTARDRICFGDVNLPWNGTYPLL